MNATSVFSFFKGFSINGRFGSMLASRARCNRLVVRFSSITSFCLSSSLYCSNHPNEYSPYRWLWLGSQERFSSCTKCCSIFLAYTWREFIHWYSDQLVDSRGMQGIGLIDMFQCFINWWAFLVIDNCSRKSFHGYDWMCFCSLKPEWVHNFLILVTCQQVVVPTMDYRAKKILLLWTLGEALNVIAPPHLRSTPC